MRTIPGRPFVRAPRPVSLTDLLTPDANSFGVLRLALALIVLVSHSLWFVTGQRDADPMVALTGFTSGEHAVQAFFLLSGLLVARSIEKSGSIVDFTVARALRIFPGLVVCVLLTAFVLGPLTTQLPVPAYFAHPDLPIYIAKTAALVTASARLPDVFEGLPLAGLVNGSLWTLKFEILCYLALGGFAAVGLMVGKRRIAMSALLLAIIAISSAVLPTDTSRYSAAQNVAYFAIPFSLGVLACLARDRIPVTGIVPVVLAAPAYLAIGSPLQHVTTGLCLGTLVLWLATFRYGPLRTFANRTDLSFGVYIYAGPIQQALIQCVPGVTAVGVTALALAPVLSASWLSWTLVERPAMGWRQDLVRRIAAAQVATVRNRTA